MIKFLHAADLHLGAPFSALTPEKAAQRRREQIELAEKIFALAEENACALVLLAGDLFDSEQVSPEAVEALQNACARSRAEIFIAPGNHDPCRPGSYYLAGGWPENVHIFKTREISRVALPKLSCAVYGAGFEAASEGSLLEGFRAEGEGIKLMVLHGDAMQKDSPYNAVTRAQMEASGLNYLALGHIHQASGLLKAGGTSYAWPGCAMGRGFDELGEKGVYVGQILDGGEVKLQFLPLGGRRYEILRVEAGDDALSSILAKLPQKTEDDIYRVILTGEADAVNVQALSSILEARFFGLTIRDETRPKKDLWQGAGEDTLRGLFLETMRARFDAAEDDAARRTIALAARLGLDAMDGRLEVTM